MSSAAIYGAHSLELLEGKFIISDGIRFNYVRLEASFEDKTFFPFPFSNVTQKNTAVNGNLGLVYMPGMDWRFKLLGSSGFRAPNVDDLSKVFESVPGNLIIPNPRLKPEYVYNVESGISKTFHKNYTVSIDAFYSWYRNAITTRRTLLNGQNVVEYNGAYSIVVTNVNAAEAFIYGGTAAIQVNLLSKLSLNSSLTYTYGRIKTDTTLYPLDHIPPMFGKAGLAFTGTKIKAEFYSMYNGWKRVGDYNLVGEDNFAQATAKGMPSWYTLNIRVSRQFNQYVNFQLAVENLMDVNYRVFASGISAPGRNVIGTLRFNF